MVDVFTTHVPDAAQSQQMETIRTYGKIFASVILDAVPACADQQAAIRHVREAVFTANSAIMLHGKV